MQQTQKLCIRVCYFLPVKTPGAHKAATVIISMSFIVIVVCFCFQSTFARFVNLFAFLRHSHSIYTTYTLSINLSCQSQVRLFGPDSAVINLFVGQLHYQMNIILKYCYFISRTRSTSQRDTAILDAIRCSYLGCCYNCQNRLQYYSSTWNGVLYLIFQSHINLCDRISSGSGRPSLRLTGRDGIQMRSSKLLFVLCLSICVHIWKNKKTINCCASRSRLLAAISTCICSRRS